MQTTQNIIVQGPAIVIWGFDYSKGRHVCQQFGIHQGEEAEAFKKANGPHFLCYSSFHKGSQTFSITPDDVTPDEAREAHRAAEGRWFGDFNTAE